MHPTDPANQVWRVRTVLVISLITMSVLSLAGGFTLSMYDRSGTHWFLLTAVAMAIWATVTATTERISASDFVGILDAVKNRDITPVKERKRKRKE